MCIAAVYLDHHWIIDILCGWTYTIIVIKVMRRIIPMELSAPALNPAVLAPGAAA